MAANARAIEAGKAVVRFSLSSSDVATGLKKLKAQFNAIGSKLRQVGKVGAAIGGAITGAFAGALNTFAAAGDKIDKMSQRTGISTDSLQELGFAAEHSGAAIEDIEKAAINLKKKGLDPANFDQVADEIAAIEDPVKRSQKVYEMFGKSAGAALEPMLASLADLRRQHRELNIGIDKADVQQAAELTDAFGDFKAQLKAVVIQLGAAVAGPLTAFFKQTRAILAAVIQWVKDNRSLIRTVALVGGALLAAGTALVALGTGFTLLGAAAGGLATAVTLLGSVLGGIVAGVGALISPLGIIAGLLAAGVWAWTQYTASGKATIDTLSQLFGRLKDTFFSAFNGIKDALASGDLATAGKIGLTALQIAWLEVWGTISDAIGGAVGDLIGDLAGKIGSGDFKGAWDTAVLGMSALWDKFVAGVMNTFGDAAKWITDRWAKVTTSISKQILALAKKFPMISKALLGVDVAASQEQAEQLRKQEIDIKSKRLAEWRKLRAAGPEAIAAEGWDADHFASEIAALEADLIALGNTPVDVLGDMQRDAAAQLQGTSDAIKDWIDKAPERAAESTNKFFDSVAGGSDRLKDSLAESRKQLDELRKEAARNAEERAKEQQEAAEGGLGAASATAKATRGTFSADAVMALQSANGPEAETAKNTARTVKLLERIEQRKGAGGLTAR